MIRADYSGLDWKKIGIKAKMTHRYCGGAVMYNIAYESYFCATCGNWIDTVDNKNSDRPKTAIQLLNITKH